jgi:hypothetical protein
MIGRPSNPSYSHLVLTKTRSCIPRTLVLASVRCMSNISALLSKFCTGAFCGSFHHDRMFISGRLEVIYPGRIASGRLYPCTSRTILSIGYPCGWRFCAEAMNSDHTLILLDLALEKPRRGAWGSLNTAARSNSRIWIQVLKAKAARLPKGLLSTESTLRLLREGIWWMHLIVECRV